MILNHESIVSGKARVFYPEPQMSICLVVTEELQHKLTTH